MSDWNRIVPLDTEVWVPDNRISSYGYAQSDPEHKSRKRKHPLGFQIQEAKPKAKSRAKRTK